jgi:hypothetical protein
MDGEAEPTSSPNPWRRPFSPARAGLRHADSAPQPSVADAQGSLVRLLLTFSNFLAAKLLLFRRSGCLIPGAVADAGKLACWQAAFRGQETRSVERWASAAVGKNRRRGPARWADTPCRFESFRTSAFTHQARIAMRACGQAGLIFAEDELGGSSVPPRLAVPASRSAGFLPGTHSACLFGRWRGAPSPGPFPRSATLKSQRISHE